MQGPGGWPNVGNLAGWPNTRRRLNLAHLLAAGLVGWWPMDEGAGTRVRDMSPYGNHAAFVGSTNTWVADAGNAAIRLSGASGGYISAPSTASLQVSTAMSACALIKRTSASVNGGIFHKGTLGASYGDWCMVYDGTYSLQPDFRIAYPGSGLIVGAGTPAVGDWVHAVCTYDKVNARMYVNGVLKDTRAYATNIAQTATPLNIGVYYDVPYTHAGMLRHCRLYNRALSAAEVKQLYADPWIGAY